MLTLEHKQMYWIQTNFQRFQPSNVKRNIQNVYTLLHNGMCAVLVSYVSSQKGQFIIVNCTRLMNVQLDKCHEMNGK